MNKNKCIIYGVRSPYVYEVIESASRSGIEILAFIDNLPDTKAPLTLKPLVTTENIKRSWSSVSVAFGTITPGYKKRMHLEALDLGLNTFLPLVDPTAVVASTARLSLGVQINTAAVVSSNSCVDEFALINRNASIGHDVHLGAYSTLGPGCIICGSSLIGSGSFIGAGAVISPGCSIGTNSIVGAGAIVTKDVPDNCIVVGNPATVSRENIAGYNGVSV